MIGISSAKPDIGYGSGNEPREAVTRIIKNSTAASKGCDLLKADWTATPIGAMLAVADANALHLLKFFDGRAVPSELERLQEKTRSSIAFGRHPPIDSIKKELRDYFAGRSSVFRTPLARHGSPFSREVWDALRAIPPGSTKSYSEIAHDVERPSGIRAVGRANGANQIVIVIPCHRVIGADGSLTGYGGGLWRKRWLLKHERRMMERQHEETADGA
jgi:AraC family transcriptional regulator of adaptative response/methylated-DNA-[protein]-cysteine methyltransferase